MRKIVNRHFVKVELVLALCEINRSILPRSRSRRDVRDGIAIIQGTILEAWDVVNAS